MQALTKHYDRVYMHNYRKLSQYYYNKLDAIVYMLSHTFNKRRIIITTLSIIRLPKGVVRNCNDLKTDRIFLFNIIIILLSKVDVSKESELGSFCLQLSTARYHIDEHEAG